MKNKLKQCEECTEKVYELYETDDGRQLCGDCFASDYLENFDESDDSWLDNPEEAKVVTPETKPVTIRLNVIDIQRAKKKAAEKNMPYQTFLKNP